jgi:hypothetical protein
MKLNRYLLQITRSAICVDLEYHKYESNTIVNLKKLYGS